MINLLHQNKTDDIGGRIRISTTVRPGFRFLKKNRLQWRENCGCCRTTNIADQCLGFAQGAVGILIRPQLKWEGLRVILPCDRLINFGKNWWFLATLFGLYTNVAKKAWKMCFFAVPYRVKIMAVQTSLSFSSVKSSCWLGVSPGIFRNCVQRLVGHSLLAAVAALPYICRFFAILELFNSFSHGLMMTADDCLASAVDCLSVG